MDYGNWSCVWIPQSVFDCVEGAWKSLSPVHVVFSWDGLSHSEVQSCTSRFHADLQQEFLIFRNVFRSSVSLSFSQMLISSLCTSNIHSVLYRTDCLMSVLFVDANYLHHRSCVFCYFGGHFAFNLKGQLKLERECRGQTCGKGPWAGIEPTATAWGEDSLCTWGVCPNHCAICVRLHCFSLKVRLAF